MTAPEISLWQKPKLSDPQGLARSDSWKFEKRSPDPPEEQTGRELAAGSNKAI